MLVVGFLLAGLVAALKDTDATAVISLVIAIEAVADIVAILYLASLIVAVRENRLWLLLLLFTTATMTTIGCVAIGFLVALRFLGYPPLPNGLGLLITGMGLVIAGAAPVTKALTIWFWRRSGDPTVTQ